MVLYNRVFLAGYYFLGGWLRDFSNGMRCLINLRGDNTRKYTHSSLTKLDFMTRPKMLSSLARVLRDKKIWREKIWEKKVSRLIS